MTYRIYSPITSSSPLYVLLVALGLSSACSGDISLTKVSGQLTVAPELSDIGIVPVGESAPFYVTLYASGGDVQVNSVDIFNGEGDFLSFPDTELPVVTEDEQVFLEFLYEPDTEGFHWGLVTIRTSEAVDETHEVQVRGQAVSPDMLISPMVIDYGVVMPGGSETETVTVTNTSDLDIELSGVDIDSALFTTSASLPADILAGASLELPIVFTPLNLDESTGTLTARIGSVLTLGPIALRGNACSTATDELYDQDDDGFSWCAADCDDNNALVHPGGVEICDGLDNDCDSIIDEETTCSDDDLDGFTEDTGDCNDTDPDINPDASEDMDNGVDDDCDGVIDAGGLDLDDDGYTEDAGDCDDLDPSTYPGAPELADLMDNDCDGTADEGTTLYDDDRDGYTERAGDCDDSDSLVYPGATELEDWIDNDCDGVVDEETSHTDDDGDGYAEWGGDCNDSDSSIRPGAPDPVGDGIDSDCDGIDG